MAEPSLFIVIPLDTMTLKIVVYTSKSNFYDI